LARSSKWDKDKSLKKREREEGFVDREERLSDM